jgi:hypothetical protein
MLGVIYAQCHLQALCAECRYAGCHAECRSAPFPALRVRPERNVIKLFCS